MPKSGEYVKFKSYEKKIKSPFVKHFESFLVPENNGKQNLEDSFSNKCLLPAVMGIN